MRHLGLILSVSFCTVMPLALAAPQLNHWKCEEKTIVSYAPGDYSLDIDHLIFLDQFMRSGKFESVKFSEQNEGVAKVTVVVNSANLQEVQTLFGSSRLIEVQNSSFELEKVSHCQPKSEPSMQPAHG